MDGVFELPFFWGQIIQLQPPCSGWPGRLMSRTIPPAKAQMVGFGVRAAHATIRPEGFLVSTIFCCKWSLKEIRCLCMLLPGHIKCLFIEYVYYIYIYTIHIHRMYLFVYLFIHLFRYLLIFYIRISHVFLCNIHLKVKRRGKLPPKKKHITSGSPSQKHTYRSPARHTPLVKIVESQDGIFMVRNNKKTPI